MALLDDAADGVVDELGVDGRRAGEGGPALEPDAPERVVDRARLDGAALRAVGEGAERATQAVEEGRRVARGTRAHLAASAGRCFGHGQQFATHSQCWIRANDGKARGVLLSKDKPHPFATIGRWLKELAAEEKAAMRQS
jgi:hypothetical protein